jgi:signal transduction histidine kinase
MKPLKRKRQRILLLFLLGVGVPSLLLGYLAFRGIQNDQALLEKQNREELQETARKVTDRVNQYISETEELFRPALGNRESRSLLEFKTNHPLIEEILIYQDEETILFPALKLLYLADGSLKSDVISKDSFFQKQFRSALQAEFQEKNFRKAAALYLQLAPGIQNPSMRGELLNSLARAQKKARLFTESMDTYQQIIQEYNQMRSSTGTPLGLAARLELASLHMTEENPENALKAHLGIYKDLVNKIWTLEKAEYDFFTSKTIATIENLLSGEELREKADDYLNEICAIKEVEVKEKDKTKRLLAFKRDAPAEFQLCLNQDINLLPGGNKRLTLEIGGRSYLVSLFTDMQENNIEVGSIWGFLLDQEHLKIEVVENALDSLITKNRTGWIVRDKNGASLLASETIPSNEIEVQTTFSKNFPDWHIEFYQQDPRLFESFLTSRRGIYFFIFLLIGGILIFGLALTVRIVSHELELSRMKSDFVSTISHEFKSPLTSIRQLAEMLQSGRIPSEERRQKYYDVLVEQSERLTLLTENILNFAKMEEGKKDFKFESVEISALLEDIVAVLQERISHYGFKLELKIRDTLPPIMADSAALTQAINNLLDNAIKYSGDSKKIVVKAEVEDPHVIISIRDFGLGIKKEEREKVFERFYRGGDPLTRTIKGSGLGLTLVKQIVDAHKGAVDVVSEWGAGSTFLIKLPLNP